MQSPSASIAQLTIPPDRRYLALCRLAAGALGQGVRLSDRTLADLRLAVSEVCALLIADRPAGAGEPINVSLRLTGCELEVEVTGGHADAATTGRSAVAALGDLLAEACCRFSLDQSGGGFRATFAVLRPV